MVEAPAFLAPMAGVTDLAMRRIARRFGAGLAFSEMVASGDFAQSASGKGGKGGRESALRALGDGVLPHAVQIAGCEPDSMAEAARLVEGAGADLIDINMGCPAKRVVGGAAGSALMRDLDHAARLIAAVIARGQSSRQRQDAARLGRRIASMRRSLRAAPRPRAPRWWSSMAAPASNFIADEADWAAIRPVCEAVNIPVVANGDCRSAQDAHAMLAQSGAKAAMIGRAALGQPWIVGEIAYYLRNGCERPGPSWQERREAALEHYATLLDLLARHKACVMPANISRPMPMSRRRRAAALMLASRRRLVRKRGCGRGLWPARPSL